MYSIVDIESTGGAYKGEKIIDIAIYNFDGTKITKVFSSLVNPGIGIPSFISQLTGISNEMVKDAPKFEEIAKDVVDLTKDQVFIAHNVQYDYNIIKQEFKRIGYRFERKKLCTVRLSELLFPDRESYNLGTLCKDLGIEIQDRHRAAGDAEATVGLFDFLMKIDNAPSIVDALIHRPYRTADFAPHVDIGVVEKLPEDTGVYYFFGKEDKPLYVGKSNNIRERTFQHLGKVPINKDKKRLYGLVESINYEITGSELIALILESYEIKRLQPKFNKKQRNTHYPFGLYKFRDKRGYINFRLRKRKENEENKPIGVFENMGVAKAVLDKWIAQNKLCPKLSGRDGSKNACMSFHTKKCKGACINKEKVSRYNMRVKKGVKRDFGYKKPNFLIISEGRSPIENAVTAVVDSCFYGYEFFDSATVKELSTKEILDKIDLFAENPEIDKIIRSYLKRNKLDDVIFFEKSIFDSQ